MIGHEAELSPETQAKQARAAGRAPTRATRLTRRELEVLEMVADGYSTREIAEALWVTHETVKTHVRRVLRRLRARTRAQAVAIAYRENLWGPQARSENGSGRGGGPGER